jgi:hypothetical protein
MLNVFDKQEKKINASSKSILVCGDGRFFPATKKRPAMRGVHF